MPELPEVETMRRDLEPDLWDRRIQGIRVLRSSVTGVAGAAALTPAIGMVISKVGRRAKTLIFESADGRALAYAPLMTGQPSMAPTGAPVHPHDRAIIDLDDGESLRLRDMRGFARLSFLRRDAQGVFRDISSEDPFAHLGPEATEPIDPEEFAAQLRSRRFRNLPLKAALLDQRLLAGLGNIYADEVLWRARLSPVRAAGSLNSVEIVTLLSEIPLLLSEAIERRGSRIYTYSPPGSAPPTMQLALAAYGRAGRPCLRCSAPLVARRISGRTAVSCPSCQVDPQKEIVT